jgi:hypothetical protein
LSFAFGERRACVGAGLGFEWRTGFVQRLDGSDPGPADAENLGNLGGGHAVIGEGDDTMAELDGPRFHGRHLGVPTTIADHTDRRKNEI